MTLRVMECFAKSLKVIRNDTVEYFIETVSVCRTVCEIFSIKEWRDLETVVVGCSRSLLMAPFDRSYTTFYWSAIVSIAVCCIIFKLFDVK